MNTEVFDLGKIGITLGGEYDNRVVYEKLTIVLYKGKSYISTKITQGVSPEQDILVWQLVAEAKDAYNMLVDAGKTTLTEEEFLEQLVDATKGRYIVQGNVINAADEEDLTVEHSDLLGIDTLKLANRDNTNGMGYVILRKNKSFAEQITKENTIYEIRYDFDLNGENITIPNNCIFKFEGGSLKNGTLTGTDTSIVNGDFNNVNFSGNFIQSDITINTKQDIVNNSSVYPNAVLKTLGYRKVNDGGACNYLVEIKENQIVDDDYIIAINDNLIARMLTPKDEINILTFGAIRRFDYNDIPDSSDILQKCVNIAKLYNFKIFIPSGDYKIDKSIRLKSSTIIKGIHGYSFRFSSRFYTTRQGDDYIMFIGTETDSIRHCTFDGITFMRDRTNYERNNTGYSNGEGYGLAGTCFYGFTELRVLNCGFIGWGTCFKAGAICFSDHTDYGYNNNIMATGDNKDKNESLSSIIISNANIWCCGDLIQLKYWGIDQITISNTWIEYARSLCTGKISTRTTNIVFDNIWYTNTGYNKEGDSPCFVDIDPESEPNANIINIIIKSSKLRNNGQFCKYFTEDGTPKNASTVHLTFNDSHIGYNGDISKETCTFYGNSTIRDLNNDYNIIGSVTNAGIDTVNSIINSPLNFKYKDNNSNIIYKSPYAIYRNEQNKFTYKDDNDNRHELLEVICVSGSDKDVPNPNAGIYLTFNPNPTDGADFIHFYNKITGVHKTILGGNINYGPTSVRPINIVNGDRFFDSTIRKPLWGWRNQWGEPYFIESDGEMVDIKRSGSSTSRPTPYNAGFQYFDTTLNKPIYWTGSKWVDANGTDV